MINSFDSLHTISIVSNESYQRIVKNYHLDIIWYISVANVMIKDIQKIEKWYLIKNKNEINTQIKMFLK